MKCSPWLLVVAAFGITAVRAPVEGGGEVALEAALDKLRSSDDHVRLAGRREVVDAGAAGVAPLAELMASGSRETAISARHALEDLVHHAGRPDAPGERTRVAAELAKLTYPGNPDQVRREAVHLLGYIGGAAEVPALSRALEADVPHLAETARLSLERIPAEEAVNALLDAVKRSSGERKADLLYSIGKKNDHRVVGVLVDLSGAPESATRLAALGALARMGAPQGVRPILAAVDDRTAPDRAQLFTEILRLADNLPRPEHTPDARSMYINVLENAPLDFQREHALHELSSEGEPSEIAVLLVGLRDPSTRVQRLAMRRLSALEGREVIDRLKEGYASAPPEGRPALLRTLAERDASAAEDLVSTAARSSNLELKVTALDLQGRLDAPELEGDYLECAKSGSRHVRVTAMKGYLLVAKGRLEKGEKDRARDMFCQALEVTTDAEQQRTALRGLTELGDPASEDCIRPFLGDSRLAIDAAEAYLCVADALGKRGNAERAEECFTEVLTGRFPRALVERAAEGLRRIGKDPQRPLRARGFVLDWHLVGPIQDPDGKGLAERYFPEERVRLGEVERIGPRRFRWQRLSALSRDGRIDLVPRFRRSERVLAYAYSEVEVPSDLDVDLRIGSDDGVACWVNGTRVHFQPGPRGYTPDEDTVPARLVKGKNRILVKVANGSGDWEFSVRITDREGRPLDLSR